MATKSSKSKSSKPTDKQLGQWADRLHTVADALETAAVNPAVDPALAQHRTSLVAQLSAVEQEIREAI